MRDLDIPSSLKTPELVYCALAGLWADVAPAQQFRDAVDSIVRDRGFDVAWSAVDYTSQWVNSLRRNNREVCPAMGLTFFHMRAFSVWQDRKRRGLAG